MSWLGNTRTVYRVRGVRQTVLVGSIRSARAMARQFRNEESGYYPNAIHSIMTTYCGSSKEEIKALKLKDKQEFPKVVW